MVFNGQFYTGLWSKVYCFQYKEYLYLNSIRNINTYICQMYSILSQMYSTYMSNVFCYKSEVTKFISIVKSLLLCCQIKSLLMDN